MPIAASAEKRVALLIGNAQYQNATALKNTLNDTRAMAEKLKALGFEAQLAVNLDARAMRQAIRAFGAAAAQADVALVFYAGHGMEMDGKNYLVPVDAMLNTDLDLEYEAVPLQLLLRTIEAARRMRIVILDACRNNPLLAQMTVSGRITRQVHRGLAKVEPGADTLVAFAARDGTLAEDGSGANSPYTGALLQHLDTPGLEIGLLFRRVRDTVLATTNRGQEPFVYGSLGGQEFYLNRASGDAATNGGDAAGHKPADPGTSTTAAPSQIASLPSAGSPPSTESAKDRLSRDLQRELKRVGCDPGESGSWDKKSQAALEKFAAHTKLALHIDEPTSAALDAVGAHKVLVCPLEGSSTRSVAPMSPVKKAEGTIRGNCHWETRDECRARLGMPQATRQGSGKGPCQPALRKWVCR